MPLNSSSEPVFNSNDSNGVPREHATTEVIYTASGNFAPILESLNLSLLVSTYQAGKLISVGSHRGQLQFAFHGFDKVMGVAVGRDRIAVGARRQIHFLNSNPEIAPQIEPIGRYDSCWLPRISFHTGSILGHDLAWGSDGLWVVNTLFSCLCKLSRDHNFVPIWRPPFVSQLIDQDRCHMNGLAIESGTPRYVTVLAETNTAAGWREHKVDGGAVIDIRTNETICRGLCMPHSPRIHNGELWFLNSGRGELGRIERREGSYQAIAKLPGYTRGLAFSGGIAFVGLSRIRETNVFGGLPIGEHPDELCCGVGMVDVATGQTIATLRFASGVEEIFAVETIPGSCNPKLMSPGELEAEEKEIWIVPPQQNQASYLQLKTVEPVASPENAVEIDVDSLVTQATAAQQQGHLEEAFDALQLALASQPHSPSLHNLMGNLCQDLGKEADAIAYYERALILDPTFATAHQNLGVLSAATNVPQKALSHFEAAQKLNPTEMNLMLAATVLPVIYESQEQLDYWRKRVEDRVADMVESGVVIDTADALIPSSFNFAYHGKNDRPLMENLAKIYRGVQCCEAAKEGGWRPRGKRLRIGFLSAHFCNHTIGRLNIGMVERLPRDDFEIVVISLRRHEDAFAERFRRAADQYVVVPRSPRAARTMIADLKLDVLLFTDVGMDALTQTLCYSRMAPIQAATWGHPVTTGSPAIDYFLSSDLAEPENAQEHYSEHLIRLPGMGVYYERPSIPEDEPNAGDFGLPANRNLYLCPQTLFKFHPAFDEVIEGILQGDPKGELVTIASRNPRWMTALQSRWRIRMPDFSQRIHFLPPLPHERYLQLLRLGHVMLDPFPFGGGNTSYEAIAMGTPIVTMETDLLRGRLTSGLHRQIHRDSESIHSGQRYIDTAIQFACDSAGNPQQRPSLLTDDSILFFNDDNVSGYARALRSCCENEEQ